MSGRLSPAHVSGHVSASDVDLLLSDQGDVGLLLKPGKEIGQGLFLGWM